MGASHRPAVQKSVPWDFFFFFSDLLDHKITRTLGILLQISLNLGVNFELSTGADI